MEHKPFPPDATKPPQSRFPWPLIAILLVAVLFAIVISLIPRTNRANTAAMNNPDTVTRDLKIASVTISPQSIGGASNVDVYGQATNTGARNITAANVSATFKDKDGKPLFVEQEPIEMVEVNKKDKDANAGILADKPLKPRETMNFRVRLNQVPSNWNHEPPDLSVLQVTEQK